MSCRCCPRGQGEGNIMKTTLLPPLIFTLSLARPPCPPALHPWPEQGLASFCPRLSSAALCPRRWRWAQATVPAIFGPVLLWARPPPSNLVPSGGESHLLTAQGGAGPNSWVPAPAESVPGPGWVNQGGRDRTQEPPRPAHLTSQPCLPPGASRWPLLLAPGSQKRVTCSPQGGPAAGLRSRRLTSGLGCQWLGLA